MTYIWTIVNGVVVTLVAAFGFKWIVLVAWITGPAFFIVAAWLLVSSPLWEHGQGHVGLHWRYSK